MSKNYDRLLPKILLVENSGNHVDSLAVRHFSDANEHLRDLGWLNLRKLHALLLKMNHVLVVDAEKRGAFFSQVGRGSSHYQLNLYFINPSINLKLKE